MKNEKWKWKMENKKQKIKNKKQKIKNKKQKIKMNQQLNHITPSNYDQSISNQSKSSPSNYSSYSYSSSYQLPNFSLKQIYKFLIKTTEPEKIQLEIEHKNNTNNIQFKFLVQNIIESLRPNIDLVLYEQDLGFPPFYLILQNISNNKQLFKLKLALSVYYYFNYYIFFSIS
ncbi:transmembrane protein, putative (macronuclear) [Tetrahymena thermophila SB210]|uniref:Transmembrane protein, putative n=1 Tax=Tetrahymena thermophila (strain SB210) TaxID=312017 RepID=W7XDW9_TETTS|nr:transmembrane protein, putative [Tetrahymena thermophila SB210]EWS71029.1 transmembrane protein, putative [Tetrahymena thermophila SB210]|eukprot:XP_012656437.1 transmembrane protein, putative [Tetrahymena thermophila SB210]